MIFIIYIKNFKSKLQAESVSSQLKFIARAQYSSPPKHGAHIVDIVLSDKSLNQEWQRVKFFLNIQELKVMANRISSIRQELYNNLVNIRSKNDWSHIIKQIGMFAYTVKDSFNFRDLHLSNAIYLE